MSVRSRFGWGMLIWSICAFAGGILDHTPGIGVIAVAIIISMYIIGYHIYWAISFRPSNHLSTSLDLKVTSHSIDLRRVR